MTATITAAIEDHLLTTYGDDYYSEAISVALQGRLVRYAMAQADRGTVSPDDDGSGAWHWSWDGALQGDDLSLLDAAMAVLEHAAEYAIAAHRAGSLPA